MKMVKLAAIAVSILCASTAHAAFFATSLVSQQFTTAFGSGLVTGAPDGGGLFLGDTPDPPRNPGRIVVGFSTALTTGSGIDLKVYDVGSSLSETFDVFVSPDNITFTFVGGANAVNSSLDFGALFSGAFSFVRLVNSSTQVSIDIDAVEGFYQATGSVPESTTWAMMIVGFGLVGGALRSRRISQAMCAGV
jgi:hypothetical protein